MSRDRYYTLIDIDQIQNYIFSTPALKEIRGASAILNKIVSDKEIQKRVRRHCGKLIYTGGGTTKALFKNKKCAQIFIIEEIEMLKNETENATLTAVIVDTNRKEYKKDFKNLNIRAERKLHEKKDSKVIINQVLAHPHFRICDSCRTYPATKRYITNNQTNLLCTSCYLKNQESLLNRFHLFSGFTNWLKNKKGLTYNFTPPNDLNRIGEFFSGNNYIGLIICDANRMGEKLREIGNSPQNYKKFSKTIKEYTRLALFESLYHTFNDLFKKSGIIPIEIIILGGDDIVCIVPANKAIELAKSICQTFHKKTVSSSKTKKEYEISMSAGVAIAHSKFPLARLHAVAEELIKSAKSFSSKFAYSSNPHEVSTLDFAVISSPSTNPMNLIRDKEFTCDDDERYLLYRRPYRIYDTVEEVDTLACLTKAIRKFKKAGLPKTKLNQLYEVLQSKKHTFITFDSLVIYSRLKESHQDVFKQYLIKPFGLLPGDFPWQKFPEGDLYKTPVSDLIELYEFIE